VALVVYPPKRITYVQEAVIRSPPLVVQIEGSNMVDLIGAEPPLTCFNEVAPPRPAPS
jgi:hypothetical protein